jgi:predicted ribosome quality control (RQC) complex YloA/Tae2 family protein
VLTLAELSRAVRVLAPQLAGRRIQDVAQPDSVRVVLTAFAGGEGDRRIHWLLCADPETARLSLVERPPRRPPSPPAFAQWLKAHVVGARVAGLALLGGDRVVAADLETPGGRLQLVLQLLGRRSNVYVLDAAGRLAAALRPLDATRPELSIGEPWRLPASAAPRPGDDRFANTPDPDLLLAIEAAFAEREALGREAALSRQIDQVLHREERRLSRKLEKLEMELASAREASQLARHGELLKGALSRVRRGDARIEIEDPETGAAVPIDLDPTLSPAENLDALFRRYKKALRGLAKGGAQAGAVRAAHAEILALRRELEAAAGDPARLASLAERPALAPLLRQQQAPAPERPARARETEVTLAGRKVPRRLAPRRYPTAGGLEIWVGRNDAANDFLTTRLARGKDLFFHLDGAPGSHVVLATGGREDPPSDAILDACELAVHFSKARDATRADVHVVPIRNVRKPKGAKPGLVTVHGGRSVHLRRTPARLERLLASKLED